MTALEWAKEIAKSGRLVRMRVAHPEKGTMTTTAYCALDAALLALGAWGLDFEETKRMKVYLDEPK